MVVGLEVIRKEVRGVAGGAGVRRNNAGPPDDGMSGGAANQGDRSDGAIVAGCTGVVIFDVVWIDQKCRQVAGLDTRGVAAADKGAVVWNVICQAVCMAVNAAEGEGVARACLADGVGDRAIDRIDAGACAIASGRVVAGAATVDGMSAPDVVPRLDLPSVATDATASFACREVSGWVVR